MKLKFIKKQTVLKNVLFTNAHIHYFIKKDISTSIIYLHSVTKLDSVGIELQKNKDLNKKSKSFLDISLLDYIEDEYDFSESNIYIYKIKFNSILNIISISIKNNIKTNDINNISDVYLEYEEKLSIQDASVKKRLTKSITAILYDSISNDYRYDSFYVPSKIDNSDIEILSVVVQFMNNKTCTLSEDLYTYDIIEPLYEDEPYKIRLRFNPPLKNINKVNIIFKNKDISEIDEYCNYIEYIKVL